MSPMMVNQSFQSPPVRPVEWTTPVKEGDSIPSVTFRFRVRDVTSVAATTTTGHGKPSDHLRSSTTFVWKDAPCEEIFIGKRIVLFALPGAFTPTCSTNHLPGYIQAYHEILSLGVDDVYCVSVNDAFVMRQWGLDQGLEENQNDSALFNFKTVKLIPDGSAHFTRGMGMSCFWDELGERSWRYSAVVTDGTIEKLFVEQPFVQNSGPDPFDVSDATSMIQYLRNQYVEYE